MIEQNAFTIIFGIFMLFTCRDVFYGSSGHQAADHDLGKTLPPSSDHLHHHHHHSSGASSLDPGIGSSGSHISGLPTITPSIKIQYCQSCGYRQAFDEISKMLQLHYPGLRVEGEVHQPGWLKSQIVNLLFLTKSATLAMLYMDINPFIYFQIETPRVWDYMTRTKISSSLIILSVSNIIETSMVSTGAFEIFYNDIPIWSKIQTGRMPSIPELHQIVQSQVTMGSESLKGKFVPI